MHLGSCTNISHLCVHISEFVLVKATYMCHDNKYFYSHKSILLQLITRRATVASMAETIEKRAHENRCNRLRCPLARLFGLQCFNMGHNGHGINLYGVVMICMGNLHAGGQSNLGHLSLLHRSVSHVNGSSSENGNIYYI